MFKYIIIGWLMLSSITSYAQIYRFRATQLAITQNEHDPLKWRENNSLIVQNYENKTITIYGDKETTLAWTKNEEKVPKSETYIKHRFYFEAIDEKGEKCRFQIDICKADAIGYDCLIYFWYGRKNILLYTVNLIK